MRGLLRRFLLWLRYQAVWVLVALAVFYPWGILWMFLTIAVVAFVPGAQPLFARWYAVFLGVMLCIVLIPGLIVHNRIMRRLRRRLLPERKEEG